MKGIVLESFPGEIRVARLARGRVSGELDDSGAPPEDEAAPESSEDVRVSSVDLRADLLSTIHERLIPQLVLAHAGEYGGADARADTRVPPTSAEVRELARVAVVFDAQAVLAMVRVVLSEGASLETVFLNLIAPAAQQLGDDWLDDEKTFAEVTLGLGVLREVVHILGLSFVADLSPRGAVVLVSAPLERGAPARRAPSQLNSSLIGTLGLYVLAEFLRRSGWGVDVEPAMSRSELLTRVGTVRLEMVGISLADAGFAEPLERLVVQIKERSLNADLAVLITGHHDLAVRVERSGARFCSDPREVVRWLEQHTTAVGARPRN